MMLRGEKIEVIDPKAILRAGIGRLFPESFLSADRVKELALEA
jgi:hypothetical protein